jgi:hypothetical protein
LVNRLNTPSKSPSAAAARGPAAVLLGLLLASCGGPPPVLRPPAAGVEAVSGYAWASVQGEEMALKGKFAFLFREPESGRVDVPGPFGATVYSLLFERDSGYLVVPSKKVYAEEPSQELMNRFLGFGLGPDEVIHLLSGVWTAEETGPGSPWSLQKDAAGRIVHGESGAFRFDVSEFFPGAGVPRSLFFSAAGASGRIRILSLRFNPEPRPEAFDTAFLKKFRRGSWDDIRGLLKDED